jgi:hypothetical protein
LASFEDITALKILITTVCILTLELLHLWENRHSLQTHVYFEDMLANIYRKCDVIRNIR